ncbi:MCE family protein [Parasphingorhabdus pacifica]
MTGQSIAAPLTKFLIFVLVTLLASGLLIVTIANNTMSGSGDTYKARFTDVTSLHEGDDIRISGVKVGKVEGIEVVDRRLAEVTFSVVGRKLPASSNAVVKYRNLVGQRYIALEQGAGDSGEYLNPGSMIPLERTKPALDLTVLLGGFKPLFQALSPEEVNKLSFEIIQVLQGEGGTMESLLAHTASLTSTIAAKDKVIGEVITNLNGVLETVNARDEELSGLIVQLQQVVSGLAEDRESIGSAMTAMDGLTNATADLLTEARPPLEQDIAQLGQLSSNLNDHEQITEQVLQNMPGKLEKITRTATHGSWFNFYNCKAEGTVGVGELNLTLPLQPVTQERCRR